MHRLAGLENEGAAQSGPKQRAGSTNELAEPHALGSGLQLVVSALAAMGPGHGQTATAAACRRSEACRLEAGGVPCSGQSRGPHDLPSRAVPYGAAWAWPRVGLSHSRAFG